MFNRCASVSSIGFVIRDYLSGIDVMLDGPNRTICARCSICGVEWVLDSSVPHTVVFISELRWHSLSHDGPVSDVG